MFMKSLASAASTAERSAPGGLANAWATELSRMVFALAMLVCLGIVVRHSCFVSVERAEMPAPSTVPYGTVAVPGASRRNSRHAGEIPIDPSVQAASYARFSSALQDESSNVDQQRKCREMAAANGHQIAPNLEFSDSAISGTKLHRDGLDDLLAAAQAGELNVLYFHSLSRLSRESVITLPLLKQLVYNYGVRVISVTEGIDSNDTAWELIAHIMSIVHEQYVKDLAKNVLRGQEGAIEAGFSVGDFCFGYDSVAIPGSERGRRGRNPKPRKMYVIDSNTAAWVPRIFHWFVRERRSLRWIARELNRLGAPKDHRAKKKSWRHQYVTRLLKNRKYIGWWSWGVKQNVRDPLTGKIRQKDRPEAECEQWLRHLPDLRLVDDDTFEEAQRLLTSNQEAVVGNRSKTGKLNGSSGDASVCHPRHLLSKLIQCGGCDRNFIVGGSGGKYLFCPGYAMGTCSCQTQLRRDRAERMILDQLGLQIFAHVTWSQQVLKETLAAWRAVEAAVPSELAAARQNLTDVEQKITNLLDRVEDGRGGPELDERLAQRRAEKRELAGRIERLARVDQDHRPQPTAEWVAERLSNLSEVFTQATPAAAHALRDLVGGAIVVHEIREAGRKRHYLQGRFSISSGSIAKAIVGLTGPGGGQLAADGLTEEIVIDFREPASIVAESEQAKALYDQGLMNAEIAKQMGCARSRVTQLLKFWFESRGLEMPDGRSRRSTLKKQHLAPPMYQEIADPVMALYEEGLLLGDIAEQLECDRNTVTSAIRWWHEERGLPVPDGRSRRKELDVKGSPNNSAVEMTDLDQPLAEPSDRADMSK